MMFIRTIVGLALVTAATSTHAPLVDQLFKLEPSAYAALPLMAQSKQEAAVSSTDVSKFADVKDFPLVSNENQVPTANTKEFPFTNFINGEREVKTFAFPPLMVKKNEKHHSELLPSVSNTKSAATNLNLPLFSEPRAAAATIPEAFLQKKPEPKLSPSGIPLAFLEKKPAANFEKVSLATPKSKRAEKEKKENELPFVQFNLRKRGTN